MSTCKTKLNAWSCIHNYLIRYKGFQPIISMGVHFAAKVLIKERLLFLSLFVWKLLLWEMLCILFILYPFKIVEHALVKECFGVVEVQKTFLFWDSTIENGHVWCSIDHSRSLTRAYAVVRSPPFALELFKRNQLFFALWLWWNKTSMLFLCKLQMWDYRSVVELLWYYVYVTREEEPVQDWFWFSSFHSTTFNWLYC